MVLALWTAECARRVAGWRACGPCLVRALRGFTHLVAGASARRASVAIAQKRPFCWRRHCSWCSLFSEKKKWFYHFLFQKYKFLLSYVNLPLFRNGQGFIRPRRLDSLGISVMTWVFFARDRYRLNNACTVCMEYEKSLLSRVFYRIVWDLKIKLPWKHSRSGT